MNTLENYIENSKIDEAVKFINDLGRRKCKEYAPLLLKHLESTDNGHLRNMIALALSDMGSSEVIEPIIRLLNDPKTLGYRGTLLAALEPFDYSPHIELFFNFIYTGNFEVSRKSFILIEGIIDDIPNDFKEKSIKKLKSEIEDLQEKIDFLNEAIEMLINE